MASLSNASAPLQSGVTSLINTGTSGESLIVPGGTGGVPGSYVGIKKLAAGTNISLVPDASGGLTVNNTAPAGATTYVGLTDVDFTPGPGVDGVVAGHYNDTTGKFEATPELKVDPASREIIFTSADAFSATAAGVAVVESTGADASLVGAVNANVTAATGAAAVSATVGAASLTGATTATVTAGTGTAKLESTSGQVQVVGSVAAVVDAPIVTLRPGSGAGVVDISTANKTEAQYATDITGDGSAVPNVLYVNNTVSGSAPNADAQVINQLPNPTYLGEQGSICEESLLYVDLSYNTANFSSGLRFVGGNPGDPNVFRCVGRYLIANDAAVGVVWITYDVLDLDNPAYNRGRMTNGPSFIRAGNVASGFNGVKVGFWNAYDEGTDTASQPVIDRVFRQTFSDIDGNAVEQARVQIKNINSYDTFASAINGNTVTISSVTDAGTTYWQIEGDLPQVGTDGGGAYAVINTDQGTNEYIVYWRVGSASNGGITFTYNSPLWQGKDYPLKWVVENAVSQPTDYSHTVSALDNLQFGEYGGSFPITTWTQDKVNAGLIYGRVTNVTTAFSASYTLSTQDTRLSITAADQTQTFAIGTARCAVEPEVAGQLSNKAAKDGTDTGVVALGSTDNEAGVASGPSFAAGPEFFVGCSATGTTSLTSYNGSSVLIEAKGVSGATVEIIPQADAASYAKISTNLKSAVNYAVHVESDTAAIPNVEFVNRAILGRTTTSHFEGRVVAPLVVATGAVGFHAVGTIAGNWSNLQSQDFVYGVSLWQYLGPTRKYRITLDARMFASVQDQRIRARLKKNGVAMDANNTLVNYSKNSTTVAEGQSSLTAIVELANTDTVSVEIERPSGTTYTSVTIEHMYLTASRI